MYAPSRIRRFHRLFGYPTSLADELRSYFVVVAMLCLILALASVARAQVGTPVTGTVTDKQAGFAFDTPEGWVSQSMQGTYRVASESAPGVILVFPHTHTTLEQVRAAAYEGLHEEGGTSLSLSGTPAAFDDNGIAADFTGTFQWTPARGRAIGLLSPHGGGMAILALAETASFTPEFSALADRLARSFVFTKPDVGDVVEEWRVWFAGKRVVYMESYSSSGGSYGGYSTGGGYSMETNLYLCSSGAFTSSDQSSMSVDTGGAFGNSSSQGGGEGSWEIGVNAGTPVLRLHYHTGDVAEYTLSYEDEKTYLNGSRWFVVENPVCN